MKRGSRLARDEQDSIASGDVIDGRFRVERVVGRGGMGVVYQALHLQLREPVAVKVLRPSASQDEQSRSRFLREARASARLRSEHVVRLMDFGLDENGSPIIVMEYLEGLDLGAKLENGPLSVDQTVEVILQATEGIAEAHAHGLIHRDLKPGNLFVTRATDGSTLVKVLDFGVSKLSTIVEDSVMAGRLTDAKSVVGSPSYMSPEQLSGEPTDVRTDIWSLGVILFECLTGRPPFLGRTVPQVFSAILDKQPPRVAPYRDDVPQCLQALLDWCLEKNRDARCPDTAALAAALAQAAPSPQRMLRVERIERLARVAQQPRPISRSPEASSSTWTRRRSGAVATPRTRYGIVLGSALVLGTAALLLWLGTRKPEATFPTAAPGSSAQATGSSSFVPDTSAIGGVPAPSSSPTTSGSSESHRTERKDAVDAPAFQPTARPTQAPPALPSAEPPSPRPERDPLDGWDPLQEQR